MEYRVKLPAQALRVKDKSTGLDLMPGVNANRKEEKFYKELSMLIPNPYHKNESKSVVTVRLYGTDSRIYACVWICPKEGQSHGGGGFAGGGGYHKASAAMCSALDRAGISLEYKDSPHPGTRAKWLAGGLSGRGDSAMRDVMKALAKAAGHPRARLHIAHA